MSPRVLVLDDNRELADNVRDVLVHGLGVAVTIASDARTGLRLARTRGFDVAIVDVKLPDASGIDVIAGLREACPRCEVVLLTGYATVESAILALRAGAAGFLLKSFRPEELVTTVEQSLQRGALRRERELYERRYHALVHATDMLVVGLDADGRVIFVNPELGELLGVPPEDAVGRSFTVSWVDEADARRFEAAAADATSASKELEIGMRDRDGAIRRIRWNLSAVRADGSTTEDEVYGIGVDVTARRALERRAATAEALHAMAPLALGLAHEIRNPLNAAVLELHLLGRGIGRLEDAEVRDPMRRRVEIVESEIRRLERLLTEFLELAKPRAPAREPVDLARVARDVLALEAQAIARRGVEVEPVMEEGVVVEGDVEKLKQVVLNLIVNALEVMPDGGRLGVFVHHAGAEAVLEIVDSGEGIDPRVLADVFDPFFTTKPAGTGLGLAIVRKVVEQHGGRVGLAPAPTGGTRARVALPRLAAPQK